MDSELKTRFVAAVEQSSPRAVPGFDGVAAKVRSRRRRRRMSGVAAAACVVGILGASVVGAYLAPQVAEDSLPSDGSNTSAEALDLRPEIREAVQALNLEVGTDFREVEIRAEHEDGRDLERVDFAQTRLWNAEYEDSRGASLDIVVIHTLPPDLARQRVACATNVAELNFDRCEVRRRGSSIVAEVERWAQRVPGGWPIVSENGLNRLQGQLYRLRQTTVTAADGLNIQVAEVVPVEKSDTAGSTRWLVPRASLLRLAEEPELSSAVLQQPGGRF